MEIYFIVWCKWMKVTSIVALHLNLFGLNTLMRVILSSSCDKNTDLLHAKTAKRCIGEKTVLGRHLFFVWVGVLCPQMLAVLYENKGVSLWVSWKKKFKGFEWMGCVDWSARGHCRNVRWNPWGNNSTAASGKELYVALGLTFNASS